ncbi:hypothetical protein CEP54_012406 [Fusarium duplospermum]|uniref:Heterokaryon incompatibility domain-containing protein n=1 Tax=Fusarium duplospermum TaxID=1325734 RepID=A0A428P8T8_9HYPO|nr:hypothetical protein CEP54_012406 [Fusarium duplospermum]
MPKRLICISQNQAGFSLRLVETEGLRNLYCALSYCWGGDQTTKATKNTLAQLKAGIDFHKLPATLQDAITATHGLGLRYLFVDSLCILQDDDKDMHIQISQMSEIYSEAAITILASRAKAVNFRFLHKHESSIPRAYSDTLFKMSLRCPNGELGSVVVLGNRHMPNRVSGPLSSRGWAFQENLLSARTLNYEDKHTIWRCSTISNLNDGWLRTGNLLPYAGFESVPKVLCPRSAIKATEETEHSDERPDLFQQWHGLLEEYSRLELSISSDKLPAISTIATRIGSALGDEYLAGIWKSRLPQDLLWHGNHNCPRPKEYRAPSWSWAAIDGYTFQIEASNRPFSLEVLECHTELESPTAPYGAVKGGHLVVRGRLRRAILSGIKMHVTQLGVPNAFHIVEPGLEGAEALIPMNFDANCYPIRVEDHPTNLLVRLPCPNQTIAPTEKTLAEAATAAFIHQHTQLPVPKALHYGDDPEIGPFMIIPDLGTRRSMSGALEAPRDDPNDTPVLDPNISEDKLRCLYSKLARCVLQLTQPTFPRLGALVETGPGSFSALGRPITLNMNNMVQLSNVPKSIFPSQGTTYETADEWYVVLAEMQMATLVFQHNDMVSSEDDCRNKYVARQLFLRLAKQGRLSKFGFSDDEWSVSSRHSRATLPSPDNSASFRLWCDDFRPVNVLVDQDDEILGVIDWEFAYAAPSQFALDPPWWLLLDVPEMWDDGIEDWASVYQRRLKTWLSAMEQTERDTSPVSLPLSAYMRESWATGRFWLSYAARKSWAFDTIFWKYLDERFFGEREKDIPKEALWKTRVQLLNEDERAAMEPLVQTKMEESQTRVLVDWDAEEAKGHLSSFLFD